MPRHPRLFAGLSLLVIAAFIAGATVLVIPGTAAESALASVVSPYFSQRWRLFAPSILKVNMTLSVQAAWKDESGKFVTSDWVNVTEMEYAGMTGDIAPSKIQQQTWQATNNYIGRYGALTSTQQERVRNTFISYDDGHYASIPGSALVTEMTKKTKNTSAVVRFLRYDNLLKRYAAAFATEWFGRDIDRFRWRVERRQANDFEHRLSDVQQYQLDPIVFGWRHNDVTLSDDLLASFADVIDRYGLRVKR